MIADEKSTNRAWSPWSAALVLVPIALSIVLVVSCFDTATSQLLFVNTTYYLSLVTVLCWVGTYLHAAREVRREAVSAWLKENWPGILLAATVTVIAALAVEPALRMLSDEANLLGTSKNFFASKTATFTVSGKNYYDSYWDVDVAIDRRPTLFPFLVSLVHAVRGYSYRNAFVFNLLALPAFFASELPFRQITPRGDICAGRYAARDGAPDHSDLSPLGWFRFSCHLLRAPGHQEPIGPVP